MDRVFFVLSGVRTRAEHENKKKKNKKTNGGQKQMKNIKRLIASALVACSMLALVGCGAKEEAPAASAAPVETPAATEAEYKLGMGVVLSTASSKENNAQVDATVAAVVLDDAGKIVLCRVDVAQNKMDVTGGAVDTAKTFKTKMELGADYGMAGIVDNNGDGVMLEWDAQAKAFEEYAVGKTGAEIAAMETQEANGHLIAVDEALLAAGCSMQITDFVEAVSKACEDANAVSFKTADAFTLGVAAVSEASESTAASAEADASVKMYSEFGAAVVAADGKILAALNDATQPKITVSVDGAIVEASYKGTKRELGPDYGMVAYGAAIAEWDAQSAAFSAYTVGKTAAEVRAIETKENDHGYAVPVDETLYASCTMQITGMMEVIARAADYAR